MSKADDPFDVEEIVKQTLYPVPTKPVTIEGCPLYNTLINEIKKAQQSASVGEDWQAYVEYHNSLTYLSAIETVYGKNVDQLRAALSRKLNHIRTDRKLDERIKEVESKGANGDIVEEDVSFACGCLKLPGGDDRLCEYWFDSIIGLDEAKQRIREGFIYPLKYINLFGRSASGVLLYGPPGTGKTMMAKAMINELEDAIKTSPDSKSKCARFLYFAPSTDMLKGKYVGETEKKITMLFTGASKLACQLQNHLKNKIAVTSIIFIDEVDGLAPSRDVEGSSQQIVSSAVNTLLQMMDGVNSPPNVSVVAATNWPKVLDSAFLRRFTYQIPIDIPNDKDTEILINLLISKYVDDSSFKPYAKSRNAVNKWCSDTSKIQPTDCIQRLLQSTGCTKPRMVHPMDWKRQYVSLVNIEEKFPAESRKAIAHQCVVKHYSNADITKMVDTAIKLSATAALNCKRFYHHPQLQGRYISINSFANKVVQELQTSDLVLISPTDLSSFFRGIGEYINVVSFTDRIFPNSIADEMYVVRTQNTDYFSFMLQYKIDFITKLPDEARISTGYLWLIFDYVPISTAQEAGKIGWWDYIMGKYSIDDLKGYLTPEKAPWFGRNKAGPLVGVLFTYEGANEIVVHDVYTMAGLPARVKNAANIFDYWDSVGHIPITEGLVNVIKTRMIPQEVPFDPSNAVFLKSLMGFLVDNPKIDTIDIDLFDRYPEDELKQLGYVNPEVTGMTDCVEMLEKNSMFVNYDLSTLHFQRALEITESSYKDEEYKKFNDWRTGKK
jgi:SpoVK/Ycf46/Vps4 family AAA+-type ATPase